MVRLVERLIELAGRCSVLPRRDHSGFPGTRERFENTLIGIIGLVGDQHLGGHLRQQRIGAGEIMSLSRDQQEAQRIAERVDQSMDFGGANATEILTARLVENVQRAPIAPPERSASAVARFFQRYPRIRTGSADACRPS